MERFFERYSGVRASPQSAQMVEVLSNRQKGKVRWDNTEGRYKNLKEGVPQGSPVSPLLFCLATAKLPKVFKEAAPNCRVDQFADDLTICTTERTVEDTSSQLEPALNAVEKWAEENEMKIAGEKTAIIVVSVDPGECNGKADTSFKLAAEVVTPSKEVEILGVTIGDQLTFASHAQNMRKKLNRRMSVLTALSG